MRRFRFGGAVALLAVVLGCGGMPDVKTGANAVVPAGFPLPAPPGGTLETSADLSFVGMSTLSVVYKLPEGDNDAVLDLYEQAMKDAGLDTTRTEDGGQASVSGASSDGKQAWSAVIGQETGGRTVTLVTISR